MRGLVDVLNAYNLREIFSLLAKTDVPPIAGVDKYGRSLCSVAVPDALAAMFCCCRSWEQAARRLGTDFWQKVCLWRWPDTPDLEVCLLYGHNWRKLYFDGNQKTASVCQQLILPLPQHVVNDLGSVQDLARAVDSQPFSAAGARWRLKLRHCKNEGCFSLYLQCISIVPPPSSGIYDESSAGLTVGVRVVIHMLSRRGKDFSRKRSFYHRFSAGRSWGFKKFCPTLLLQTKEQQAVEAGQDGISQACDSGDTRNGTGSAGGSSSSTGSSTGARANVSSAGANISTDSSDSSGGIGGFIHHSIPLSVPPASDAVGMSLATGMGETCMGAPFIGGAPSSGVAVYCR
jgi:hypothetical protein